MDYRDISSARLCMKALKTAISRHLQVAKTDFVKCRLDVSDLEQFLVPVDCIIPVSFLCMIY